MVSFTHYRVIRRLDLPPSVPLSGDCRAILLRHVVTTGTCQGDPYAVEHFRDEDFPDTHLIGEREIIVVLPIFLAERQRYTELLSQVLAELRFPIVMLTTFIDQIYKGASDGCFRLDMTIECLMCHITVHRVKPDKSLAYQLECCEKVRIDSLEDGDGECVICLESLNHFEGVDKGIDQLIRLPCLHLYHEKCIFGWLKDSDFCPVCRCSLPVVEKAIAQGEQVTEEEQAMEEGQDMEEVIQICEPSLQQLHWPMLLTVTAGGILSAMLVYRLLKQNQG